MIEIASLSDEGLDALGRWPAQRDSATAVTTAVGTHLLPDIRRAQVVVDFPN